MASYLTLVHSSIRVSTQVSIENAIIPQDNTYGRLSPGFLFLEDTAKYSALHFLTHSLLSTVTAANCLFISHHLYIGSISDTYD
jgi:hypothetical protein